VVRVTVTGEDAARGELKLSEIPAEVVPIPGVGDVPAIAFQRADGRDGTLADFRGKFVVVHFWASWCGPCKHQLPALRQLCEALNDNRSATLSLSLDEDLTGWQSAVKDLKLPWPQGRLAANSDSGVSSVPAYWLLDPAGKIVSKVFDVDELAKALAEHMK
jgi:thiol-disulfide isomerase/thioredoxin